MKISFTDNSYYRFEILEICNYDHFKLHLLQNQTDIVREILEIANIATNFKYCKHCKFQNIAHPSNLQ